MAWNVQLARDAARAVERLPAKDRDRIVVAMRSMADNPFGGDIKRLKNERAGFRRRVGAYRIFFDVDGTHRTVTVIAVARRTSTTY